MHTRFVLSAAALSRTTAALACSLAGSPAAPSPAAPPEATPPAALQAAFAALPAGDAAQGQQLFTSALPCHVCHMDQPIGPKFPGDPPLAVRAATRRPAYSPEQYLYESITNPSAFVVPGFDDGLMPSDFGRTLSQQQLDDLIAYLKTLQ